MWSSTTPIQYIFPIKLSVNGPVVSTKIISPIFYALVYVLFLTSCAFSLDSAHPSQTWSVPVNLTPRAFYAICNNFSPRCEYPWTTLISISLGRPNFLCQYYFSLLGFFFSVRFIFASWGFDTSGGYLFAFKCNGMLVSFPFHVSSIMLTPFFFMVIFF